MPVAPPLARYNAKRDFAKTPEPAGEEGRGGKRLSFVIQKHWASHLHYDFRLELDGVLVSWAVPKGPSYDPKVKRMAIHVEDHPVSYGGFEGTIPEKQYGAGTVIVWDRGTWEPEGDPREGMRQGKVVFRLHGEKLVGLWELVKIAKPGDRQEPWILFKKRDDWARASDEYDVVTALPDSVIGKPLGPADARGPAAAPVAAVPTPAPASRSASRSKGGTMPAGAKKAALPEHLAPQLATLTKTPPTGDAWSVEAKFDGYRLLARVAKGKARLITRNGNDWTDQLGPIAKAVESLGIREGWLDGEIVVLKDGGGQDFNALQNAIDRANNERISYFLFDAPYLGGYDLRAVPLHERRSALKAALAQAPNDRIRFSDDFPSTPAEVLKAACAMQLEGVIAKRRDASYVSARSDTWVKLKCTLRQEFVIGGYTDRSNSSKEVGNLFLGVYEGGKLRYAGAVGTGWSLATARELKERLQALRRDQSPFEAGSTKQSRWSKRVPGTEHWVAPTLVAEVSFAEWTPEGHLRHASFQGLRADKPAKAIVREVPAELPAAAREATLADADDAGFGPGPKAASRRSAKTTATSPAEDVPATGPAATKAVSKKAVSKKAVPEVAASTKGVPMKAVAKKAAAGKPAPTKAALKKAAPERSVPTKAASKRAAVGTTTAKDTGTKKAGGNSAPSETSTARTASGKGVVSGIRVSSPDRIIDASSGATKLDLVRYYDSVAELILPHLAGRPVSLVRGPSGVAGELFFQKHMDAKIAGVTVLDAALWPDHTALMQIDTREALLSAAQFNTIEFHTWNARSRAIDTPDRMIFDLDPGEGLGWTHVQEAATLTRAILDELGLASFLKTSGGKGLHVVVPLTPRADWDTVKGFSQAIVQHLAKTIPDRFVAKSGPSNRVGKIFVDYLRNGHGATTAVAFSARSRPGLGVSMPVEWDALGTLKSGAHWTIATARDYLSFRKSDPWAAYDGTRQTLTAAMKRLGYPGAAK